MRSKSAMFVSALFLLLLSSGVASAQVRVGISLGGGYYAPRPYYGRGYYAPRPVVVAAPVYYAPPVVYPPVVYPAPYYARPYYAPRPYYGPRYRGYYGRRY